MDPDWVAQLYRSLEGSQQARRERARSHEGETADYDADSDDYFAYIAGYTPGGAPYGVTWDEWRQLEAKERQSQDSECPF
jgi:hypothetical protein